MGVPSFAPVKNMIYFHISSIIASRCEAVGQLPIL